MDQRKMNTFTLLRAVPLVLAGICLSASSYAVESGDGKSLFERRCTGCHSLDRAIGGPPLRGVYGRQAGTVPGFPYSQALQKSRLTWDDATLDRWLADPGQLVPDTDMEFRVPDAAPRAAIIGYLKSLGGK
jgi:cytochrome c